MQTKTNKETETKTKYRQQLLRGSNVMALRTFALVQTQCVNFSISCFATCVNGLRREASWFPLSGFSYLQYFSMLTKCYSSYEINENSLQIEEQSKMW